MGRIPQIARQLDRASEAVILAIVVLAPWAFGAVEAWAGFLIAVAIVVLTLLGLASACLSDDDRGGFATPALALVGLAALAVAQAAPLPRGGSAPSHPTRVIGDPGPVIPPATATIALDREAAIRVASWLTLGWAFFLGVFRLKHGRRVAAAIAVNSAVLAVFAMIQALTWNGKIYGMRESPQDHAWFVGGPFVCHNHLAAYLNLGLGFALGFLMNPHQRGQGIGRGLRLGWAYVAGVVAVGVIGSQSRGGTVALLLALMAVSALAWRRPVRLGLAALGMAAIAFALLGGGAALTRLATVFDPASRGYAVRFEVWRAGLKAWLDRPMLGAGLGSFATAAAPYFDRDRGVVFTHAENEVVQLLAEGGLVAILIAGAGVVAMAAVGWRAIAKGGERVIVLGAIFGLLAVATQSLGDFALHIPAVALAAVASAALLASVSRRIPSRIEAPKGDWLRVVLARCLSPFGASMPSERRPATGIGSHVVQVATLGAAVLALVHSRSLARSESALAGSGVPLAGPAIMAGDEPTTTELQRMAAGLERALVHRPDWSEGHLRLGETRIALYAAEVQEWTASEGEDAELADPLRLLQIVHEGNVSVKELTTYEPIARYLVPAARSFLEARRANSGNASAYVGLASLHYLIEGDVPPSSLLAQARKLAAADAATLARAAEIAVWIGDFDEAARCWQRILVVDDDGWENVADAAGAVLSPEAIRDAVARRQARAEARLDRGQSRITDPHPDAGGEAIGDPVRPRTP